MSTRTDGHYDRRDESTRPFNCQLHLFSGDDSSSDSDSYSSSNSKGITWLLIGMTRTAIVAVTVLVTLAKYSGDMILNLCITLLHIHVHVQAW